MDSFINMKQNTFVKNRLIFDKILIYHELLHGMKLRKKGRNYGMDLKLDISKVYECVEWTQWILQCVTTLRKKGRNFFNLKYF